MKKILIGLSCGTPCTGQRWRREEALHSMSRSRLRALAWNAFREISPRGLGKDWDTHVE